MGHGVLGVSLGAPCRRFRSTRSLRFARSPSHVQDDPASATIPSPTRIRRTVIPAGTPLIHEGDARSLSMGSRIIGVFIFPGEVFRSVREQPKVWGVLLLGALVVGCANAAVPTELWEQLVRSELLEAGQELPADLTNGARLARWGAAIGSTLVWPIVCVIVAGIYSLAFLVGLGYRGSYRQYLSITAHTMLIGAAGSVLLVPLRILTQDVQLMLTLGAFLPQEGEGLIARSLDYLDLFNLWGSALVGLGASLVDGSRGSGASIGFALGVSLLVALVLGAVIT